MKKRKMPLWKRLTRYQWPYVYAGVVFAIAQIVFVLATWHYRVSSGKVPALRPISVTTDLGRMFRNLEVTINHLFGFRSELYGSYTQVDGQWLPGGGVFTPGIGWPIVGMMLGGLLVSIMERESRAWAYYSKKALLVSFIGGAFFSYGTRLAGGCTLTHLMGGVPVMGLRSIGSIVFMAMGGAVGFLIMDKLHLAKYFKHQETLSYVKNADKGEQATYKKGYSFKKNPFYWIGASFAIIFALAALRGALTNPDYLQTADPATGTVVSAFINSPFHKGWAFVIPVLISGIIAGVALAKSGFGTECALVSLEVGDSMTKDDEKFRRMGVPKITRTLMRSYNPMLGVAASWVVLTAFLLIVWVLTGVSPELGPGLKKGLTAGNFLGGFSLGLGAVTLIGCEIRSYMRIGLGYLNTLIGFMGFAVGYLPYTLFPEAHKHFLKSTMIFGEGGALGEAKEIYSLLSDNPAMQQFIMFLWLQGLILLFVYLLKKGSKNTGVPKEEILHNNMEDLEVEIEEIAGEKGELNGVPLPKPVPEEVLLDE